MNIEELVVKMKYKVYILRSSQDGKRYIGMTSRLDLRLKQHQNGRVISTRNRRPLKLIYTEQFDTKKEAEGREKFFKSGKGREYLKLQNL